MNKELEPVAIAPESVIPKKITRMNDADYAEYLKQNQTKQTKLFKIYQRAQIYQKYATKCAEIVTRFNENLETSNFIVAASTAFDKYQEELKKFDEAGENDE